MVQVYQFFFTVNYKTPSSPYGYTQFIFFNEVCCNSFMCVCKFDTTLCKNIFRVEI